MLPDTLGPLEEIARRLDDHNKRLSHLERLEDTGALTLIESQTLVGVLATITFSNIPSSFRVLELYIYTRSNVAATNDPLSLNFNNDVGNNYDRVTFNAREPDTFTFSQVIAGALLGVGSIAGANAPADAFDIVKITIPNYAGTVGEKALTAESGNKRAETTGNLFLQTTRGWWRSTAAITEIDITLGAGSFIAGSVFSLYGLS